MEFGILILAVLCVAGWMMVDGMGRQVAGTADDNSIKRNNNGMLIIFAIGALVLFFGAGGAALLVG